MKVLFSNNARSYLRADTGAASISLTLVTGDGAKFPAPNAAVGESSFVTIEDNRVNPPLLEICKVTGRTTDVLQVVRGQEGTTAQNFLAGARVGNRLTAGTLTQLQAVGAFLYAGAWDHDPAAGEKNSSTGFVMPTPIPLGMLYFNSAINQMKVWTGSVWLAYSSALFIDGSNSMQGDLRLNDFDLLCTPNTQGETVIDGGGGAIVNIVVDGGTF
jgi:hypothetical protein